MKVIGRIALLLGWFFGPIGLLERWHIQDTIWIKWFGLLGLEEIVDLFLPGWIEKPIVFMMFLIWGLGFYWWIDSLREKIYSWKRADKK